LTILGTVSDGGQLVDRARLVRPDIIVTDVNMPVVSGLDAMRPLKAGRCARPSSSSSPCTPTRKLASEALHAPGASGFVFKQAAGGRAHRSD